MSNDSWSRYRPMLVILAFAAAIIISVFIVASSLQAKLDDYRQDMDHLKAINAEQLIDLQKSNAIIDALNKDLANQTSEMTLLKGKVQKNTDRLTLFSSKLDTYKHDLISRTLVESYIRSKPSYKETIGMLIGYDILKNELVIDEIEYLGLHDIERIKELKLDVENDFPGGFYIYNPSDKVSVFQLDASAKILTIEYNKDLTYNVVEPQNFLTETFDYDFYVRVIEVDGKVIQVMEEYVP